MRALGILILVLIALLDIVSLPVSLEAIPLVICVLPVTRVQALLVQVDVIFVFKAHMALLLQVMATRVLLVFQDTVPPLQVQPVWTQQLVPYVMLGIPVLAVQSDVPSVLKVNTVQLL